MGTSVRGDLDARVASLFTVGLQGHSLDAEVGELIDRGVGGVIYFARNVGSAQQVRALSLSLKQRAARRLWIGVDQEGGRVARFREGFTAFPPMRALGALGDPQVAREVGQVLGRELRAVGVDIDFAPVLDVDTNPDNPVIGDRALSRRPEVVAELGTSLALGLQDAGVAACGKHFPGHGDTVLDSHWSLPRLPHGLERLEQVELTPFRAAIAAGVAALMTAHVVYEPLDSELPATMSERLIGQLLRGGLGFRGVVFSDDVEMRAVADHYGHERAAVLGLGAGVDNFLVCHSANKAHQMIDAVLGAVARGEISESAVDAAVERSEKLAARFVRPVGPPSELDLLASAGHRQLAIRVARGVERDVPGSDPTEALAFRRPKPR